MKHKKTRRKKIFQDRVFDIEQSPSIYGCAHAVWGKNGRICWMDIKTACHRFGTDEGTKIVNAHATLIALAPLMLKELEYLDEILSEKHPDQFSATKILLKGIKGE